MDSTVASLSSDLRDELTANERRVVDTRAMPLRFHHLKAMGRSPAHCLYAIGGHDEPSLAKRIGSSVHSLLFGGPPVVVYPGKVRRGKEFDAFAAQQESGAIIALQHERDRAFRIADAVRSNEVAARVLFGDGCIYEQTIHWEWMGRARRSTPDVRSHRHLVDLKSCRTAEPEKFMWDAIRMGYHAQLADYAEAMRATSPTGSAPRDVYIVAVEQLPPHAVVVRHLTPRALDMGRRLLRGWFERFLQCEAANHWPGYSEAPIDLDVPDDEMDLIFADDEPAADEEA